MSLLLFLPHLLDLFFRSPLLVNQICVRFYLLQIEVTALTFIHLNERSKTIDQRRLPNRSGQAQQHCPCGHIDKYSSGPDGTTVALRT